MNHKGIAAFLTVLLLVVLTVPAFAAQTEISVESKVPEIEVVVPTTSEIIINPYRIPVYMDENVVADQIICEPTVIENKSDVPLQIDVSAEAVIRRSTMILCDRSTAGRNSTEKEAFLYFDLKRVSSPDSVTWDNAYNASKHLLIQTETTSKENMAVLAAKGQDGRYGAFRLSGDCVEDPDSAWSSRDSIDIRIRFTFVALPYGTAIA